MVSHAHTLLFWLFAAAEDKAPPAFVDETFPVVVTEEALGKGVDTPVNYTLPSATDAVDPQVAVDCEPEPNTKFALGDTMVSCTATDDSGNSVNRTFTVSVRECRQPCCIGRGVA
jgi:hypothetical protein